MKLGNSSDITVFGGNHESKLSANSTQLNKLK